MDLKRNTASICLPTVCTASTASSNIVPATDWLSVNPATMMGCNRSCSVLLSLDWVFFEASVAYFHKLEGFFSFSCISSLGWTRFRDSKGGAEEGERKYEEKSDRRTSKESCRQPVLGGWMTNTLVIYFSIATSVKYA